MRTTYRSDVVEQPSQVRNNPINILILLHEPMALAVRDLANDIKGVELQPPRKVAPVRVLDKQTLRLLQEQLGRVVDKGLVLHQLGHGKGRVDAAPELCVEVIVGGAEQARHGVALDNGLLHHVEVGL